MEELFTFTGWVIIVFGILQIILFFKIWRMTNDVKKLKIQSMNHNIKTEANVFFLKGERQAAYNKLFDDFLKEIVEATKMPCEENTRADYRVRYVNIIQNYKPMFKKIGLGHPDYTQYDELDKVKL